jgi:hypothetical protein
MTCDEFWVSYEQTVDRGLDNTPASQMISLVDHLNNCKACGDTLDRRVAKGVEEGGLDVIIGGVAIAAEALSRVIPAMFNDPEVQR